MKRYKILHKTRYQYSSVVQLYPHTLRLRPREGHELRIESSRLKIVPAASVLWHRDVEGNSVATATFKNKSDILEIESEIIIQKYDLSPLDFVVDDYAVNYPFSYSEDDKISLSPYMDLISINHGDLFTDWVNKLWTAGEKIQTFTLLQQLNQQIFHNLKYQRREEQGVQSPAETLRLGSGSCRDFANLFMAIVRRLGLAARFVSGYVYSGLQPDQSGSTHAWAEVLIPGAGWKGFDPTFGTIVGAEHVSVAVGRRPELVPPIAGDFYGKPGARMEVYVSVTEMI